MKTVFAPHVAASGQGLEGAVEFEVTNAGLRAVTKATDDEEQKLPRTQSDAWLPSSLARVR